MAIIYLKKIKLTLRPLLLCFFILNSIITTLQAQSKSDSLRSIWENEKEEDSIRFDALGSYYKINNQAQPDSTLAVLNYYYDLAKQKNATKELYNVANDRGGIYRFKGEYTKAMSYYDEAETFANTLNDTLLKATILSNKGNVYVYQLDYIKALQNFSNALKIYQDKKNIKGESHILTSLGSVYLTIQNYDLALEYYQKALSLIDVNAIEGRKIAIIYLNIGWTNFEREQYIEAKEYYEKALKILEVTNEKFFMASCYSTLAKIHLKLKDFDNATVYAQKNMALSKELNIESRIINGQIIMAQLAFQTDINGATKQAEALLKKMPNSISKSIKVDLYEFLYKCYKAQNKPGKSLKMFENYTIYNDSIQLEKRNFAVAREAVKSEFDVKLQESKINSEIEKQQLESNQLKRTIGIIAASSLLIACIVVYYRSNIKKSRKKRDALLKEIENLKSNSGSELIVDSNKFELVRVKIEHSIDRKLNETDWKVLNILLDQPEVTNKEIAEKAYMSVDGIGSSLRRMYDYFEVKDSKYKKISLLTDAIKRSNI